jgi:hypothetical protein
MNIAGLERRASATLARSAAVGWEATSKVAPTDAAPSLLIRGVKARTARRVIAEKALVLIALFLLRNFSKSTDSTSPGRPRERGK